MAFVRADRVLEHCSSSGTGSYGLSGPLASYRSASSVCTDGDTFEYFVEPVDGGSWETGLGTWRVGNTVERTKIYDSSNGGQPINWPSGDKYFALTLTAEALNAMAIQAASQQSEINLVMASIANLLPGSYTASESLQFGQPLRINRATGQVGKANAATYTDSFVIGCAAAAVDAGFAVSTLIGRLELQDWTTLSGQPRLSTGSVYFLGTAGGITSLAPSRPANAASAVVGIASSPTVLFVSPVLPLLL